MDMNFLSDESSQFPRNYSWNCGGKLFTFDQPKVMGIVNCTPDSFYEKSRISTDKELHSLVEKHVNEGVDILDLGGYSSRPGAEEISVDEEWTRISKALKFIKAEFPDVLVSIDTFRGDIVRRSCNEGANIINDISAGDLDKDLMREVAYQKVPMILMHMKGNPQTMQTEITYKNLLADTLYHLSEKVGKAREMGIVDVAVDPGFGFSKTMEQNYELLKQLGHFHIFEVPLLVGLSRKSMIYKALDIHQNDSLNGTTVLNTIALSKGAHILRVHDVKEAKEAVKLIQKMNQF